jgi:hypothetical protein
MQGGGSGNQFFKWDARGVLGRFRGYGLNIARASENTRVEPYGSPNYAYGVLTSHLASEIIKTSMNMPSS